MDFKGLGGYAIAIIAGLLLFLIVPGWASGSKESDVEIRSSKSSDRLTRLANTAKVSSLVAIGSLIATVFIGIAAVTASMLWLVFLVTAAVFLASAFLALAAARTVATLQKPAAKRTNRRVSFETKVEVKTAPVVDERAWTPTKLPDPLSNRLGELRQVAPVVSIEKNASDSAASEIDVLEILKRRRAI
jgi:Na+/H+-dicarboxylate symporter